MIRAISMRVSAASRRLVVLTLMAFPLLASAQLQEGRDYALMQPVQRTSDPSKIEVIEFFSYACPHCNEFHPILDKWAATLPKDVVLIRVPVEFGRAEWGALAKTYYALQFTDDLQRLDGAIFRAIHEQHLLLADQQSIGAWLATQGVDRKKFNETFSSFSVMTKKAQADRMATNYRIDGVPALYVDGKYQLVGAGVKSYADWPALLNQMIEMARGKKK